MAMKLEGHDQKAYRKIQLLIAKVPPLPHPLILALVTPRMQAY